MISLCMDSAYKALVLGLYKDGTLIDGVSIEAFKKQSETIFVELNQLLEKTGLSDHYRWSGFLYRYSYCDDNCESILYTNA